MRNTVLLTAGTAVVAGVLSTVSAAPAQAQQASFAGSATVTNPSSLVITVSAERTVSRGKEFANGTNFVVTPAYAAGTPARFDNSKVITNLSIGILNAVTPTDSPSFTAAAARALTLATNGNAAVNTNKETIAAIIRAGAGVDGLD